MHTAVSLVPYASGLLLDEAYAFSYCAAQPDAHLRTVGQKFYATAPYITQK